MHNITNYERIKNMSIEEMEEFIVSIYDDRIFIFDKHIEEKIIHNYDEGNIKKWLLSEADDG